MPEISWSWFYLFTTVCMCSLTESLEPRVLYSSASLSFSPPLNSLCLADRSAPFPVDVCGTQPGSTQHHFPAMQIPRRPCLSLGFCTSEMGIIVLLWCTDKSALWELNISLWNMPWHVWKICVAKGVGRQQRHGSDAKKSGQNREGGPWLFPCCPLSPILDLQEDKDFFPLPLLNEKMTTQHTFRDTCWENKTQ